VKIDAKGGGLTVGKYKLTDGHATFSHVTDIEQIPGSYATANAVPLNLLLTAGYPSIGCEPCTKPVAEGEDPRSGRWAGLAKTECGLHE